MKKRFLMISLFFCLCACSNQNSSVTKQSIPQLYDNISFQTMIEETAAEEGVVYEQKQKELIALVKQHKESELIKLSDNMNDEEILKELEKLSYCKAVMPIYSKNKEYAAEIKVYYAKANDSHQVKQIMHVSLEQSLTKQKKQFQGEIFVHLEAVDRIHYIVNGAYYLSGETTIKHPIDNNDSLSLSVIYDIAHPYHLYDSINAEGNIVLNR